tara:strand:+ start:862 stop:1737 length:876 start_codon:yes stop_codon:yes gene_type:complete
VSFRRSAITGYVAGGLGNQLFILAAAWEQAERLGVPLALDTSHFGVKGTRTLELQMLETPARVLPKSESWASVRLSAERVLPIPTRWGRVFLERTPDAYMPAIEQIHEGTTLVGYFQSGQYFPRVRDRVLGAMRAQPTTPAESDLLARIAAEPAVTVHLRRGDYLAVSADRQLIASVDYVRRALSLLGALGVRLPLRVFSDSVDLVKQELGADAEGVDFVDAGALGTYATINAMALGHAMVMSNSSFSWWAATLLRTNRPDATVIAPRPWNSAGTAKADMLEPDWISLDAR